MTDPGSLSPAEIPIKVFLSYNHEDSEEAARLRTALEDRGVSVHVDRDAMRAGEDIASFIDRSIRETDATICLVSNRSLMSAWVAMETIDAFSAERFGGSGRRFIACFVDDDFFEPDFRLECTEKIDAKIAEIDALIPEYIEKRLDTNDLNAEKSRLYELRNNLGSILLRLKESLSLDVRGDELGPSVERIVSTLREVSAVAVADRPSNHLTRSSEDDGKGWVSRAGIGLAVLLVGLALGWVIFSNARPAGRIQFATADGGCPEQLAGLPVRVVFAGSSSEGVIDNGCGLALASPDSGPGSSTSLDISFDADAPFVAEVVDVPLDFPATPVRVVVASKDEAPRVVLTLLPYAGADGDDQRRAAFDQFRGILEDKITNLVQDLGHRPALDGPEAAAQLSHLKLQVTNAPGTGLDLGEKLRIWQQRHSLSLLTGTLARETAADNFSVHSQVFIGDLDGSALGRSFPVEMSIEPGQFRNLRDVHALTVLYALAMDARRLGASQAVVNAYLSEAWLIVRGLPEGADVPEAIRDIGERVESELAQASAGRGS